MVYEPRYIRNKEKTSANDFFSDIKRTTLLEALIDHNKIVLLGNPGIGKSTELNILENQLLEVHESDAYYPLFIDLKNYRSKHRIEDLITNKSWVSHNKVCLIFDGIDETPDIHDFISDLGVLFNKYSEKNIKTVISCRTNIYEKYLINIDAFEYFFLDGLTDLQINTILKKKINKQLNLNELNNLRVYLENPFHLNLFCDYYTEKGKFPEKVSESINLFIDTELKRLTKNKFIKAENIDVSHVKKQLEKVAFMNELMQSTFISDDNLYELIDEADKHIFEKISLIDRIPNSERLSFRHKNYQEIFSAKYISMLDTEEIISILKIDPNIDKTKPSLFNTISFLLNILDDYKFPIIRDWLLENEPEILFLTEIDRLDISIKNKIFRSYFENVAVEKTFWFSRDNRFSVEKISDFADIDYLISIIKSKPHFRSVISALDILGKTKTNSKDEELRNEIINIINSDVHYVGDALYTFRTKKFHLRDTTLFLSISKSLENNYKHDIHHELIAMISDFSDIDEYFGILKNSLYKLYEITPDRIKDNTIRGTKSYLEGIFLSINHSDHFLEILNVIFNNRFAIKIEDFYDKNFKEKLIQRTLFFTEKNEDFLCRITDAFLKTKERTFFHRNDHFLPQLINQSSKSFSCFKYIINKYGLDSELIHFIALFQKKEYIDYLADIYQKGKLKLVKEDNILSLRNVFNANNKELGFYFEKIFKQIGYEFPWSLPTIKEIEENNKKHNDFIQHNFDLFFDISSIENTIKDVFLNHNLSFLTLEKVLEIEKKWHKESKFHGSQNIIFTILFNITRQQKKVSLPEIISKVNHKYFILFQIANKIKRENQGFIIRPEHINFIKQACLKIVEEEKFDTIIKINTGDTFSIYRNNYSLLKILYFFDQKFEINYNQSFYLKTLKYCNVTARSNDILDFTRVKVNDSVKFEQQIITNINNDELDINSLKDHIDYAISNKLEATYDKIGEYLINNRYLYSQKETFNEFISLLPYWKQIDFLKKCCVDPNQYLCWMAVEKFIESNIEHKYILELSNKYLSDGNTEYISEALNVLFYCNAENSLLEYTNQLKKCSKKEDDRGRSDISLKNVNRYSNLNNLNYLKNIFDIIYDESITDTFKFHTDKSNLTSLVNNLSKDKNGYIKIQQILKDIKSSIIGKEGQFFYINHLIESSQLSYYNSISKAYNFDQTKLLIDKIELKNNPKTIIMENQFNISGGNFQNTQIGSGNTMNNYSNNENVLKFENLLKEFENLKDENEEWKDIFIQGMKDLIELKESENEVQVRDSKTKLKTFYDFVYDMGKKANDWKNILMLPMELRDKTPKLIEMIESLRNLLLN